MAAKLLDFSIYDLAVVLLLLDRKIHTDHRGLAKHFTANGISVRQVVVAKLAGNGGGGVGWRWFRLMPELNTRL